MKNNCLWLERRLLRYLEGELNQQECAGFEAHILECPACQALVQRADKVYRRFLNEKQLDVPSEIWDGIRKKISEINRPLPVRLPGKRRLYPLAAALSLTAAVLFGMELGRAPILQAGSPSELSHLIVTSDYMESLEPISEESLASLYLPADNQGEEEQ